MYTGPLVHQAHSTPLSFWKLGLPQEQFRRNVVASFHASSSKPGNEANKEPHWYIPGLQPQQQPTLVVVQPGMYSVVHQLQPLPRFTRASIAWKLPSYFGLCSLYTQNQKNGEKEKGCSSTFVYNTEHKPKNKTRGGLGTRLSSEALQTVQYVKVLYTNNITQYTCYVQTHAHRVNDSQFPIPRCPQLMSLLELHLFLLVFLLLSVWPTHLHCRQE